MKAFVVEAPVLARRHPQAALVAATLVVLGSCLAFVPSASETVPPTFRVLVFTKTAGYRHDSIAAAIAAVEQLGAKNRFAVDATEDASIFTDATLARYAVVMFLLTTGDVLDADEQAALTRYVEAGGGFVGVHSASDTEHDWPWYGELVGAYFAAHPEIQQATVDVVDRETPSTIHLPARWVRTDEWYAFASDPRRSVTVLATLDESTYQPGKAAMGSSHPIAWQHLYDGGRSWYTAGGHTIASYADSLFLRHLLGGIVWAAGYDLPRFASLRIRLVGSRLEVSASHPACYRCTLELRLGAPGGGRATTVDAAGRRTAASLGPLPPGRRRYTVVLSDLTLGAHVSRCGWVTG